MFSNYYKFFQELRKYELLIKNYKFQVSAQPPQKTARDKVPFYEHLDKIMIVKIRISTHTEYFRTCSVL